MSHQFKPGDLALIARHPYEPAVGCAVELVSRHLMGPLSKYPEGHGCFEVQGGTPWWVVDCSSDIEVQLAPEKGLIPLRGDFAEEQQREREAEPCA